MAIQTVKLSGFGISHPGRLRSQNEDTFICDPEKSIFLVADGMGGEKFGEVASQLTAETFIDLIQPFINDDEVTIPFEHTNNEDLFMNALRHAMEGANKAVVSFAEENKSHQGMGSTLTAAVLYGNDILVAHVGDSRLYRVQTDYIKQLTEDHTKVQEMVKNQLLTSEEARIHPRKNIITRCIGRKNRFKPDIFKVPIQENDRFLLASDGLSDMVEDQCIQKIIVETRELSEAANQLIDQANKNGGKDNITVVLFEALS